MERALAGLVDDDFAGDRRKLGNDVVTVLAAHEDASHRTVVADTLVAASADNLARRTIARSGLCPSRVWITIIPMRRAESSMRRHGAITACSGVTSLPSASPKPPGCTKSRCMSM
jgi:hypothetical protein